MASHEIDIEKGQMASTTQTQFSAHELSAQNSSDLPKTPLALFQLLIGINTHPSLAVPDADTNSRNGQKKPKARGVNVGLYQRAKKEEKSMSIKFQTTSIINNSLYMLQILLAATFTALSAYKDSNPVTLTVLGALNTVLAGCLAWQKGQGVPQRYRKARDQYQALLLEIEMAERNFIMNDSVPPLDPHAEMTRLQKLYDIAQADQQANYPDLYVSTEANRAKDNKEVKDQLEDARVAAVKVEKATMSRIEALLGRLEGRLGDRIEEKVESRIEGALKI